MGLELSNYDFIFGSIIIVSAILATIRGGVAELLSISTWFIALFVIRHYGRSIALLIPHLVNNQFLRSLISYVIAFVAVAIVITLLKIIFHKFIHSFGLSSLNYLLGAIFGIIRGFIICALLVVIIEIIHSDGAHSWQKSYLGPLLSKTVAMIVNAIPSEVKNIDISQTINSNAMKFLNNESAEYSK